MRALRAPTIVAALKHMIDIADHRAATPAGRNGWTRSAAGPQNDTL